MTVVFITQNHPPTFCGIGDYTANLADAFQKLGIETHIICNADQKSGHLTHIKVYPIVEKWDKTGFKTCMDTLEIIQPDWVLMQYVPHGFHAKGLPLGLPHFYDMLTAKGYSVFTFFHEFFIRSGNNWKTQLASLAQKYLAKQVLNKSKKAATSIDLYANMLNKLSKNDKVGLIPIGSNILPHKEDPSVLTALKTSLSIKTDAPIIATFGNRNITDYLPDFDKLAEEIPDFVWLICGKTSTPLATLASHSYIRYAGPMSAFDIYKHLQIADVYFSPDPVSPTNEGGTCNKSTALACGFSLGVPVVGIKGDMNNALLVDKKNILLADSYKPFDLYESLKIALKPTNFAQELGENARKLYENDLTWEILAAKHLAIMTGQSAATFLKTNAIVV
jgi:glycosyltransferase involved in cell wall biosynthesis